MGKAFGLVSILSVLLLSPLEARAFAGLWLGADYGSPLRFSGEATFYVPKDYNPFWGIVGSANVGMGGAKLAAGVYVLEDWSASGPSYEPWPAGWHTLAIKAVCVRTWGPALGVEPNRTLLGGEIEYAMMSIFSAHVGFVAPIGGSSVDPTPVITWGVGVRLPVH